MKYNVIVKGFSREPFLLTLDGFHTIRKAEEAIRWQRKGDFHEPMYVVRPASRINHWIIISAHGRESNGSLYIGGQPWRAKSEGWVKWAWREMLARHWPAKNRTLNKGN